MRCTVLLILLFSVIPLRNASGQSSPRDSSLAAFSRDLAKLQTTIDSLSARRMAVETEMNTSQYSRMTVRDWDGMIDRIMSAAAAFAERWKDDPYVVVEGFQLTMAVSPSLALRFHFRETGGRGPATRSP